jgi:hypothetical protein
MLIEDRNNKTRFKLGSPISHDKAGMLFFQKKKAGMLLV